MTETQTTTTTIREGAINPLTGHMYTSDDVATFRALQPDHPDPPHNHFLDEDSPSDLPESLEEETPEFREEYPQEEAEEAEEEVEVEETQEFPLQPWHPKENPMQGIN